MNIESKITPDNIVVLKDVLCDEKESLKDYYYLENLVKAYLFSNYPERQQIAKERVQDFFNPSTEICTLEAKGVIYAYISPTEDREAFLLVGKYKKDGPTYEVLPDQNEINSWVTE
jgi:hypothetical protein